VSELPRQQAPASGYAAGVPKGREAGAKYLGEFIEYAKASGLVAKWIEKSGNRGLAVAPKAPGY
jgi:hypothetical protein